MTDYVTVRVCGTEIAVRAWSTWREAVSAWRPSAGGALERGDGWIVDANGDPVDPGGTVVGGAAIEYRRKEET